MPAKIEQIRLGRTELMVGRTGFGALPIQRVDFETAKVILQKAYAGGINFFDTARGYTDSEEKIGYALGEVRKKIVLATKASASDRSTLLKHLKTSLQCMKTDQVDIFQLHNPKDLPNHKDPDSPYAGLLEARQKGMTRFIGITSHRLDNALKAAASGLYDTVQFPLSAISSDKDLQLVQVCQNNDVGLIAMKPLCGGMLSNAASAFAFLRQFDNLVPLWGIQRQSELEEFLTLEKNPPVLDKQMLTAIEKDRAKLASDFCRGCGYCLPCPVDIPIPMASRMGYLLRRAPVANFLTEEWQEKMQRTENCTECGQCADRCPYQLNPPSIFRKMYEDYKTFLK